MTKIDPKSPVTNEKLDQATDHIAEIIQDFRDEMNHKFEQVDERFDQVDGRFDQQDLRFDVLERKLDHAPSRIEFDRLSQRVEQLEKLLHASS